MPNNWKTYKLGEIAEVQNGYAFKAAELVGSGTPVIKIKNIISPNVSIEDVSYFNGNVTAQLEKYIAKQGDFLISMTGSTVNVMSSAVGKMGRYRINDVSLINQRVGKIYVTKPEIVSFEYLCQFLNRYEIHYSLALNATGSANQANISPAQIKDIEIKLPPLQEQQSIASILSAIDDKIENNLAINKTLEEMAMALYKHWFVDFGPFQDGEFVESELGMIPKGWEVKRLDEIAYKRVESFKFKGKEKVVFINTGDVLEGSFMHQNYMDVDDLPGQAKKAIYPEDILFSEIRPANKRYAYVDFNSEEYVVSTKFMVIRNNKLVNNKLLYRILTRSETTSEFQIIAESRSGTFPQITFDVIGHIQFALPKIDIQNKFQSIVGNWEEQYSNNLKENKSLTQLRDTLLPKLISGEVRLKEFQEQFATN
ncbi:restriction endonuclease subunit S [Flavobacterium sp. WC2429]|uniref:Restriction endonuclease subunit S n=1 Tax=Flavobacterium sp. WC2429 TaxID=3234140 RepID=A0AB39WJL7_9FLAO